MEVLKVHPRGYCYGVVDAITMAKRIAKDPNVPRPIYILGQIVHNRHTVLELEEYGIQTLDGGLRVDLLDQVPDGATVIFTAHGISPEVKAKAAQRGLNFYDATCPDVTKTHVLIRDKIQEGYSIIYIGTKGHPEPEGAMGEAPKGRVALVTTVADIDQLTFSAQEPLAIVTQTTLSQWDTQSVIDALLARYPHAEVHNEICLATQLRQEAAVKISDEVDMVVVVGDRRSNNSNRLVEVVEKIGGKPSVRVESAEDLRPEWFDGITKIAVTAGSSTPSHITRQVIQQLEAWGKTNQIGK
ncbi:MAG: 4-hydroxy-3-methylbut-2-enyl diphosphate reductase [Sulfobacillus benefaciens]|uniref:4-hydroxy-3-methylbut-2-enyl diphosphate reductase n=1 Tax=Sulfobacillus benefaciens TaxID=453960 RepID=A0A2T2XCS1_9FIRM|nr:MAG: 4-hydroxy-3-methylbut-2-enyl diphosphate reductase [Sulfobacillus benefaciens]